MIREGEPFLADRPDAPHRLATLFLLAQAHETWWSPSRAEEDDYVPDPARYRDGAEAARRAAIGLYDEVRAIAPGSDHALHAERRLARLLRSPRSE